MAGEDSEALNEAARAVWDANARWWDERVGEGNRFQRELIGPATERLLAPRAGELLLDIACGNGNFSRRLAALGARVVAFDYSGQMIERARAAAQGDAVVYEQLDATDEGALLALGEERFDGAVANMALMDMAAIEPLARALARVLKPGGRFVFSVVHPCFNSAEGTSIVAERAYEGRGRVRHAIKVSEYIRPAAWKGEAIAGQPELQYYFHRPLQTLLGTFFDAGFVLTGLEEPVFGDGPSDDDLLAWANLREVPPVLVARLRRA
jgi:2-polyprenyl-3-methyl-5-hydroxy-6-metoxy-1,4-benzoquinol methylase